MVGQKGRGAGLPKQSPSRQTIPWGSKEGQASGFARWEAKRTHEGAAPTSPGERRASGAQRGCSRGLTTSGWPLPLLRGNGGSKRRWGTLWRHKSRMGEEPGATGHQGAAVGGVLHGEGSESQDGASEQDQGHLGLEMGKQRATHSVLTCRKERDLLRKWEKGLGVQIPPRVLLQGRGFSVSSRVTYRTRAERRGEDGEGKRGKRKGMGEGAGPPSHLQTLMGWGGDLGSPLSLFSLPLYSQAAKAAHSHPSHQTQSSGLDPPTPGPQDY